MYDDRARNDARKLLELAPTLAFNRRARQDEGRLSAEVLSMKEEGSGKELEALLREALNSGLETPRGGQPIHQLKTVPLTVQTLPKGTRSFEEPGRDSVPGLAKKIAPNSVPPKPNTVKASAAAQAKGKTGSHKSKKDSDTSLAKAIEAAPAVEPRRSSMSVLVGMGLVALAAAGGAVWFAKKHQIGPMAAATAAPPATVTVAPSAPASVEGAVGIAVTRPADAPPVAVAVATPSPPAEPAPPPTTVAAPTPPVVVKDEPRPQPTLTLGGTPPPPVAKAVEPKAAPEPAPKPAKAHHAAPAARPEPKPEKTAAAEPPPKPAAPAPAPAAGGVDALLQQQLKGAIP